MSTIAELQEQVATLKQTLEKYRVCPVYNVLTRPALEEAWSEQKKIPGLAIGFLDIDDLKRMNDELGQHESSRRIAEAFAMARESEVIGRFYSGDEVAILAPASEILKPCERILSALKERGLSATIVIVPYKGEESLADATKEANDLNQACKGVRKGKIYNFLSQIV
ncbi:GGDEF domain-containing protein [Leptolyngbya boryana NIES-2135]|jgi:GGDEF domain-containing protein|uniref:GGDEF domain-containing protein n=1 Tax=Leptolyngbya boryana NIES-2135 TaxID=1973484 RepID=A0A1Z4JPG6_LEPBY|nr:MULTISPECIES: diguanylate cyclase [Leptolyngbya]BAY58538.1 GGDEF domain-containing protein [Leptolyngbya boryana NIES-2135]MBD2370783.1 diguanylate cyclase [Leptolyngbya sp. FACHB-161]MBD2377064.1 diguanylate cyclase [Leptolyngbya sp. FACHB-238]MBD2401507.1 diguanylate cyclase [Leptolyngbya sp. FACHB-239]MBD2408059.1 diguanylate cyclase [Leptolyngbya sp. FACHB-402]